MLVMLVMLVMREEEEGEWLRKWARKRFKMIL